MFLYFCRDANNTKTMKVGPKKHQRYKFESKDLLRPANYHMFLTAT